MMYSNHLNAVLMLEIQRWLGYQLGLCSRQTTTQHLLQSKFVTVRHILSLVPSLHCQRFLHVEKKNWRFFSNMQKKLAVETGYKASAFCESVLFLNCVVHSINFIVLTLALTLTLTLNHHEFIKCAAQFTCIKCTYLQNAPNIHCNHSPYLQCHLEKTLRDRRPSEGEIVQSEEWPWARKE